MKCCVCERDRDEVVTLKLTIEEKVAFLKSGRPAVDELHYCRPCWKVLSNKVQGAQLIKGTLQMSMQRDGVRNAEAEASRYVEVLLKKAAPKPVS